MNATDHINVVLRKFAYRFMSRVVASLNSIVTAIVNSDAYISSVSTDEKVGEYAICLGITMDRIISQYVDLWRMTL